MKAAALSVLVSLRERRETQARLALVQARLEEQRCAAERQRVEDELKAARTERHGYVERINKPGPVGSPMDRLADRARLVVMDQDMAAISARLLKADQAWVAARVAELGLRKKLREASAELRKMSALRDQRRASEVLVGVRSAEGEVEDHVELTALAARSDARRR
jgi:hypothetical protein